MKRKYPQSRKDNLVVQETNGEVLIYDLNDNRAFCLNETSALVWNLCDGKSSISDISSSISKQLKTPANEGLIWLALEQLKKENLIVNEITTPAGYEGLSRREVIKKVGLGSMIALPIVSSLIAPTGAMSASVACAGVRQCPQGNPQCTTCTTAMSCVNVTNGGITPNLCCVSAAADRTPGNNPGNPFNVNAPNTTCPQGNPNGPFAPSAPLCTPSCCNGLTASVPSCANPAGAGPHVLTCMCV